MSEAPVPIPLRTLTLLLSYERTISDPRFKGKKLLNSSLAEGSAVADLLKQKSVREHLDGKQLPSVIQKNYHCFENTVDASIPIPISPTVEVSPKASPAVQSLSREKLDLIYHESRNYDACFDCVKLFEYFFQICPAGQMLSVQLESEDPVLIDPEVHSRMVFTVHGPKQLTILELQEQLRPGQTVSANDFMITGLNDCTSHAIIAFGTPNKGDIYIVDMSRL